MKIFFKHDYLKNMRDYVPQKDEPVYIIDKNKLVIGDGIHIAGRCRAADFVGIQVFGSPRRPKMRILTSDDADFITTIHSELIAKEGTKNV